MVIFAAAAGLRPSELFGLEWRDVDRAAGVVYVRRAYANGRLKHTKTRLSNRAVPRRAMALEALDRLPPSLLDALALERAVAPARTPTRTALKPHPTSVSGLREGHPEGRWTFGGR